MTTPSIDPAELTAMKIVLAYLVGNAADAHARSGGSASEWLDAALRACRDAKIHGHVDGDALAADGGDAHRAAAQRYIAQLFAGIEVG